MKKFYSWDEVENLVTRDALRKVSQNAKGVAWVKIQRTVNGIVVDINRDEPESDLNTDDVPPEGDSEGVAKPVPFKYHKILG